MELVKIVIPIYKTELNEKEKISLEQCMRVFKDFPKVFIMPESLDISSITDKYAGVDCETFGDYYFKGISGYNKLMLSSCFYERFLDAVYILIYQLDAFVFRNELVEWCNKGYDYVGAPWILKPKYRQWHIRTFLKLKSIYYLIANRPFWPLLLGDKVGNGGFSLRKVLSHYNSTISKKDKIDYYLTRSQEHSEFNEDTFWALENPDFVYPKTQEALAFSIDRYPDICFMMNDSKLPFGCHGWNKPEMINFWEDKILQSFSQSEKNN